jgi:hypothetical protein
MKLTKSKLKEIIKEELAKVMEGIDEMDDWDAAGLGSLGKSWRDHLQQDTGGLIPLGVDRADWSRDGRTVTITYWDRDDREHEIDVDTSRPPSTEKPAHLRPELSDEEEFDAAMSDMEPAPRKPRGGFGMGENKKRKVKISLKEERKVKTTQSGGETTDASKKPGKG